jgi:hypothetical protein
LILIAKPSTGKAHGLTGFPCKAHANGEALTFNQLAPQLLRHVVRIAAGA